MYPPVVARLMPPRGWQKVPAEREPEFRLAYLDLRNTMAALASQFGVDKKTLYALVRKLGLPPRMQALEQAQLPPFGKRGPRRAA